MNTKHFVAISILFFLGIGIVYILLEGHTPPPPPPPVTCQDLNATNYGKTLPCVYGPITSLEELGELVEEGRKFKPCVGKSSDLQLLESHSRMHDVLNGTANIAPNVIQLYGIIRNNSKECALKSVTMKVTFSSNGQVLQELTLNLLGEVKYPASALQPQATKDYKEDIIVFESLLTKTIGSTKLRSDVVKREQITGAEWVMPPSNKTNK